MGDPALGEEDETGCLEMQVYTMLKAHSPHGRAHTPPFPPRHQRVSLERRLITYRLSAFPKKFSFQTRFNQDSLNTTRSYSGVNNPCLFLMFLTSNPYKFAMSTIGVHSQHCGGEHFEPQESWCPLERLPDRSLVFTLGTIQLSMHPPQAHCTHKPNFHW
jgi:hypothetical protein